MNPKSPPDVKKRVHRRLVTEYDASLVDGQETTVALRNELRGLVLDEAPLLDESRVRALVDDLVHEVAGLGPLEMVLADPAVCEVMLNGPGRAWIERGGVLEPATVDLDHEALARIVERVVTPLGLRCDPASPIVDARLPDGSRFHAVMPPLAVDGPYVTIRRFGVRDHALSDFDLNPAAQQLMTWMVRGGWNLLVAGGTSSGKTTLLNALSTAVESGERIVTIEETAELRLRQPHVVRLEARPANAEGIGAVSIRELVRASLRMRPDRLIVGEVRGGEALDLLEALNTGHEGSLSTVHANGIQEALVRLRVLAQRGDSSLPSSAIDDMITAAIDGVVHVVRDHKGRRQVRSVGEVLPAPAGVTTRLVYEGSTGRVAAPHRGARRLEIPSPASMTIANPPHAVP